MKYENSGLNSAEITTFGQTSTARGTLLNDWDCKIFDVLFWLGPI